MDLLYRLLFLILFLAGFAAIHVVKALRLYLVLMEQQISFGRFMYLYLETTWVNMVIPFKLGEIYRVFRLSKETKKLAVGVLSVATDRFFDTASLIVMLFLLKILGNADFPEVLVVLLAVILAMAFVYLTFSGSYAYLNRYIIMHKESKRSMAVLSALERCREWYEYLTKLVRGRSALMILFSVIGWTVEGLTLMAFAQLCGSYYGLDIFAEYISSIFISSQSWLSFHYLRVSTLTLTVVVVIAMIVMWRRSRGKMKVNIDEKN